MTRLLPYRRQARPTRHRADYTVTLYVISKPVRRCLIAAAIFSWLVAFNVVNVRNPVVGMIGDFLYRITEPALRPIRNMMPSLGGIDISPVILILIIIFIRYCIELYVLPNVF